MTHRILVLGEKNTRTGWGRYQTSLVQALEKKGHRLFTETMDRVSSDRLWTAFFRPWQWISPVFRWAKLIRRESIEIIHVTMEPLAPIGAMVSMLTGARFVLTVHGSYANPAAFFTGWKQVVVRQLMRWSLSRCSAVIAVSRYTAAYFQESWVVRAPVFVIESGTTSLPTPTREQIQAFQERCELAPEEKLLLVVGAWKPRRGQIEAVRALHLLRNRGHKELKLALVGGRQDRHYVQSVQMLIREHRLEKRVYCFDDLGSDEQLAAAYQSARILLLPSLRVGPLFEGFGLVALEANQFGVPAIGFRGTGVEDAIIPGISGQFVVTGDTEAFADAIEHELEQPLSKEGVIQSVEGRTWKACADRVESVYDDAIRA